MNRLAITPLGTSPGVLYTLLKKINPEKVIIITSEKGAKKIVFNNNEEHLKIFISKHKKKFDNLAKLDFIEKIKISIYSKIYDKSKFNIKLFDGEIKVNYSNKGGTAVMYIESTAKTEQEYLIAMEKIKEALS